MITRPQKPWGSIATVGGLLLAVALSWGCEWDEHTAQRYGEWKKAIDETIEKASSEKDKCKDRGDQTAKETCFREWDALIQEMLKAKTAGALAYLQCDGSTLDKILEILKDLIGKAADLAKKKVGFQAGPTAGVNFADPLNDAPLCLQLQSVEVFRQGLTHVYQVLPSSLATVSFDHGASFDRYPASGQLTLQIVPDASVAHCTLIDMDIVLDFSDQGTCSADLHVTEDPESPTVFDLATGPSGNHEGYLCGWLDYALENWTLHGSYSTVLPIQISPDFTQLTIATCQLSSNIFPEDPAPTGPYIYFAGLSTDLRAGQTAEAEIHGVAPGATLDLYAAFHLSEPSGQFMGTTWDLVIPRQRLIASGVADPEGIVQISFPVTPTTSRPTTGRNVFFQGLAHEPGGNRSTVAFSAPVLP